MKRYQTTEMIDGWAVLDRRTGEVLGDAETGSRQTAKTLSELLNTLSGEMSERAEDRACQVVDA